MVKKTAEFMLRLRRTNQASGTRSCSCGPLSVTCYGLALCPQQLMPLQYSSQCSPPQQHIHIDMNTCMCTYMYDVCTYTHLIQTDTFICTYMYLHKVSPFEWLPKDLKSGNFFLSKAGATARSQRFWLGILRKTYS